MRFLALFLTLPILTSADADFLQVRTRIEKDMSGKAGDPVEKYFHESIFHPHYDGRFAEKTLDYYERKRDLANLAQTYLETFQDIGVQTWLVHGTLLGWWWNKKILPWDSDLDMQVSETSMKFLADYYNMTIFRYTTPRIPKGREYMLEINPNYAKGMGDWLNVIDGRWIDMESGLFIDITTARKNTELEGWLYCKDGHTYEEKAIYPLRDTFFEGTAAKIPNSYVEVLEGEYGDECLTNKVYENHAFDDEKMEWIPVLTAQS